MVRNKLVIFDLDGTLFDTKDVNYKAYRAAMWQCGLKCEIDYKFFCDFCNGHNYKVFLPEIDSEITSEQICDVHKTKKNLYVRYLKYAKMNQHLFSLIDLISEEYLIALATTASKQNAMDILNKFDVTNKFDLIISQEDVIKTKPDPECFLLAMEKSRIKAENTLIFEDSDTGIEAAKRSGAKYLRVYGYN